MTITSANSDTETVDHRDPEVRLRALFDRGSLRLLQSRDDSGVLSARGNLYAGKTCKKTVSAMTHQRHLAVVKPLADVSFSGTHRRALAQGTIRLGRDGDSACHERGPSTRFGLRQVRPP